MYETRSRRKSATRKKPSASFYLGYVEDYETPEMIMRKFEELEKFQKEMQLSNGDSTQNVMSLNQQEELFKRTSSTTIQKISSNADDAALLGYDDYLLLMENEEEEEDDDEDSYIGIDDDDFFGYQKKRKRTTFKKVKSKNSKIQIIDPYGKFCAQKKVKMIDPLQCENVKIPDEPIPAPWAKHIEIISNPIQFSSQVTKNDVDTKNNFDTIIYISDYPKQNDSTLYETNDILSFDFKSLGKKFECVLLDPPYYKLKNINELNKLPLGQRWFMTKGYVFIWVEKEFIADIMQMMEKWKFEYAENMVWVKQHPNNTFVMDEYEYTKKSKISLFIFRKKNEETKRMDIRHQRNPDVHLDFVKEDLTEKPEFQFHVIETLLPTVKKQGKCLELWANKNVRHPITGWTRIFENV